MKTKAIIGVLLCWVIACIFATHAFYSALSDAKEATPTICKSVGYEKPLNIASALSFSVRCTEDPYLAKVDCKVDNVGIMCVLRCGGNENSYTRLWDNPKGVNLDAP